MRIERRYYRATEPLNEGPTWTRARSLPWKFYSIPPDKVHRKRALFRPAIETHEADLRWSTVASKDQIGFIPVLRYYTGNK